MDINQSIQLAFQHYQTGDLQQAKLICIDILEEQPDNEAMLYLLGVVYTALEEYDLAVQYIKQSLQLNTNNADAYLALGAIFQKRGMSDDATNYYNKAIEIDPDFAEAYENLGDLFRDKGLPDEAVSYYKKAIQYFPDSAEIYYNLGNIFKEKKQLDLATFYYRKALKYKPNYAEAQFNLDTALMAAQKTPRNTKRASLYNLRKLGFNPRVVIDVGAHVGTFELYEVFPQSKHLLIEPVKEHESQLLKICKQLPDAEVIIAAAAKASGTVTLCLTPNFQYASIVKTADENIDCSYRTVEAIALDDVCRDKNLNGPYLIKIDVDGLEVDVLKGAVHILNETEYVIVETTLFGQFYDVMDFLRNHGFVAYDIVDNLYRPTDDALWQVDTAFVRKDGQFRRDKSYGSPEINKILFIRPMDK
jgi:FkbM family methyltransferase